jgi:hypothetical protein
MGRKRKAVAPLPPTTTPKKPTMQHDQIISPSSKIQVFKIDIFQCNGQQISQNTELGAADLEEIWGLTLGRDLEELSGYMSSKGKNGEIRVQFQLKNSMSIRDIAKEQEFTHERSTVVHTEIFKCRVVGLGGVRLAGIGEIVKVSVALPDFDIQPEQIVDWISKFGIVCEGHRYLVVF